MAGRPKQSPDAARSRTRPVAGRKPLTGLVAVVAGATRGAGRGIARALGEAGATVYCTGRSVRGNRSPYNRPETVDETAEMISSVGVSAVAITPGFLRSETMLERFGVTEETWREGTKKDKNFLESESPLFVGRAVAALAGDPAILERSGQLLSSWELGREYRFTDADGRRPDWGAIKIDFSRHPAELLQLLRTGSEIQLRWLSQLTRKTKHFLGQLPR